MLKSCIYHGLVRHRRNFPRVHQFNFRTFLLMLDLDEIDEVFSNRLLWSNSRPAVARFDSSSHLIAQLPQDGLRSRVDSVLKQAGVSANIGSVRLLTQLRYFGFAMNPVSFYYCFDTSGQTVEAIIAEVNNTPWGEQHVYVVPRSETGRHPSDTISRESIKKTFHVSPFMPMSMSYRMAFSHPGRKLGVKIENHLDEPSDGRRKILDVSMLMERQPITSFRLNGLLLAYPLISFRIFAGIYWQALRLYCKRTPFFRYNRSLPRSEPVDAPMDQAKSPVDPTPPTSQSNNHKHDSVLVSR